MRKWKFFSVCMCLEAILCYSCLNGHNDSEPYNLETDDIKVYNVHDSLCVIHPFITEGKCFVIVPYWWNDDDIRIDRGILAEDSIDIKVYKTHVATLFVNTESGTMDFIHEDKENKEQVETTIITKDGTVEYHGMAEMHGRGNLTWSAEKKPYNIKLRDKSSILGLKKSRKFCLLANAYDPTSLHNWIAFRVAEAVGLPFSVKYAYTTLYLNGNYMGLYMITNKVAVEKGSVDIYPLQKRTSEQNELNLKAYKHYEIKNDAGEVVEKAYEILNDTGDMSGGYLLELCYKTYNKRKSGFIPQKEIPCALKYPEYASSNQVKWIKKYLEETIDAMSASEGRNSSTNKHFSEYIDVPSFVKYYMIQEILMNPDGGRGSFFLYKDRGGKMFAGPIWDFDLALSTGVDARLRNSVNAIVVANRKRIDGSPFILGNMVKHSEIQDLISEYWNSFMKDTIISYTIGEKLTDQYNEISHDLFLNKVRWGNGNTVVSEIKNMKKKARERIDFLDDLWGKRIYNQNDVVRLNIGMASANGEAHYWEHEFYVKEKMALPVLPSVWEGKKNCGWYDYKTKVKYCGDSVKAPAHLYLDWQDMSLSDKLLRKIM